MGLVLTRDPAGWPRASRSIIGEFPGLIFDHGGDAPSGLPGGEGNGNRKVVVLVALVPIFQIDQFLHQGLPSVDGGRDLKQSSFHHNSEVRNQIAAGDQIASVRVRMGLTRSSDGDGDQVGLETGGSQRLYNGGSDTAGIDDQGFARLSDLNQIADTADNLEIVHAEREGLDVTEHKAEFELEFESDRIVPTGAVMDPFQDGKGGRILTASQIEAEERMWLETLHSHARDQSFQSGRPPLTGSYRSSKACCRSSWEKT